MATASLLTIGRPNRKLLKVIPEIDNLRQNGLSVADIQRVLADQGIEVCYSTVFREVKKLEKRPAPKATPSPTASAPDAPSTTGQANTPETGADNVKRHSKSEADKFFESYRHNPILDKLDKLRKKP